MLDGRDVAAKVADARRRTTGRGALSKLANFEQISPEVGVLDDAGFDAAMADDADAALATLAEMAGATDRRLRELARRLAGAVFVDWARAGSVPRRGIGRLRTVAYRDGESGDVDIEASIEPLTLGTATGVMPLDELRVRAFRRPDVAVCLAVDRSGSMGGAPLATAALAAAAVAWHSATEHSVLAFGREVLVLRAHGAVRAAHQVVDDLLALRGHGSTDLAGALDAAAAQLCRSGASRRVAVVLSDCRATLGGDPVRAGQALDELVIVAPATDSLEAAEFAATCGARLLTVDGPTSVVAVINDALGRG